MNNFSQCEISANIAFRSLINENKLNAKDAVHILNGMLVEWQREAMFQILIDSAEQPKSETNELSTTSEVE